MAVVKGSSQLTLTFSELISAGVVSPVNLSASLPITTQYSNGTGANQVDLIYSKQLTLAASTPQTLDLTSLTDLAGGAANFARVRELLIEVVDETVDHNVTLGNAASNAWAPFWGATGTDKVFAGSYRHFSDPTTVGASKGAVVSGTSKALMLDPGSNTVVVNVIIVGCSAAS